MLTGADLHEDPVAGWQRALVPSEWYESRGRRSASDWVVDSALFAAALLVGGTAQAFLWGRFGPVVTALDLVAGAAACLALWARRSSPAAVAVAAAAGVFSPLAQGAAVVAIFNTAMRGRGRWLVVVALLAVAGSTVFPLLYPTAVPELGQRFPGFMVTAVALGWGLLVRVRRETVLSLRARAERLDQEQQRSSELAREAERRRIAREMHDVLAHRLSLLSIHAGALEFRPDAPAAEVAAAAAVIRASATAALTELREVLTVLREDTAGTAPPQPALAQLPALLQESRAAEMTLRAHIDVPEAEFLPAALGRTAYRVVQEGLTNARKHAPGAAVDVTVCGHGRRGLTVEVISHPPGAAAGGCRRAPGGGGAGLTGLADRLALVGGELEHGPTADGDFVLRATVPGRP
jgi:signal transduction histidine kinase